MITKIKPFFTFFFAIVFVVLFYDKLLGINLLVFEAFTLIIAFKTHQPKIKNSVMKLLLMGTLLSLTMVVFQNSMIAKLINLFSFFAVLGGIVFPELKLISNHVLQFVTSIKLGLPSFFACFFNNHQPKSMIFRYLKIILMPITIILVFLAIYYNSNAYFAELVDSFVDGFVSALEWIPSLNAIYVVYFVCGLLIAINVFYGQKDFKIISSENQQSDRLIRIRKRSSKGSKMGLKNEYRSGVFLFTCLNVIILLFNYSDVSKVWFSYEWDGTFLREFVHRGTYLLIASLFLSIGLVLYFFRANLNFYSKNKTLKILTYIWLGQNLILIVSLAIRNNIYIENFALAYKRIGVYIFLIAAFFGVITILTKVVFHKSFHYLIRANSIIIYSIFILVTCVNWDVFIAQYNVQASENSFIELEYLLELSDKALPYIDLNNESLEQISETQHSLLKASRSYMKGDTYREFLERKKIDSSHSIKNVVSWNGIMPINRRFSC